jgi:hypothetical protein
MNMDVLTVSEYMLVLDIVRADKKEWIKIGSDQDVIDAYDSIIQKIENRINDYMGYGRALEHLKSSKEKQQPDESK